MSACKTYTIIVDEQTGDRIEYEYDRSDRAWNIYAIDGKTGYPIRSSYAGSKAERDIIISDEAPAWFEDEDERSAARAAFEMFGKADNDDAEAAAATALQDAARSLINAYAEAIGEPTPEYMAKSARLVFLAQEEEGEKPAPMHYDTVDRMQRVVAAHESDPDALRELFEDLKSGAVYGHQVNNVTYPFFWENLGIHDGYIKWNHYGASAEAVSMNDLAFVVFTIFRTTPRAFMQEYERCA